ncbi:hypothetical protein ACFQ68_18760 [Amycolatopsis japonica]|uniref:hypothetical protein n=1 Tax=Amycolatopsis japonica TaxID=208439 RepID=UPI0036707808
MTTYDGDAKSPRGDLDTPIYDELAGTSVSQLENTLAPITGPAAGAPNNNELAVSAAVLELFGRLKRLDKGCGWSGSDSIETLNIWFGEFGINMDADEATAAETLHAPA